MVALKLRKIGHSVGVTFPQETLAAMRLAAGDTLFLTEAPGGYRITPYDPEFEQQMLIARNIMKGDRNLLRELAKQ